MSAIMGRPVGQVLVATLLFIFIFTVLFAGLYKAGITYSQRERAVRGNDLTVLSCGAAYANGLQLVRYSNLALMGFFAFDVGVMASVFWGTYTPCVAGCTAGTAGVGVAACIAGCVPPALMAALNSDPNTREWCQGMQERLLGVNQPDKRNKDDTSYGLYPWTAFIGERDRLVKDNGVEGLVVMQTFYNHEKTSSANAFLPRMALRFRNLDEVLPDADEMQEPLRTGMKIFEFAAKPFLQRIKLDVTHLYDDHLHTLTAVNTLSAKAPGDTRISQMTEVRLAAPAGHDGLAAWDCGKSQFKTRFVSLEPEKMPFIKDAMQYLSSLTSGFFGQGGDSGEAEGTTDYTGTGNNGRGPSGAEGIPPSPAKTQESSSEPDWSSLYYRFDNPFWKNGWAPSWMEPWKSSPDEKFNKNAIGNCTWYAYGRMLQLGAKKELMDQFATGNANTWTTSANAIISPNVKVDSTPTVGSIAVMDDHPLGFGHVAVVEEVLLDGSIVVSESGYDEKDPKKNIRWRQYIYDKSAFNHFIHVPTNPNTLQR